MSDIKDLFKRKTSTKLLSNSSLSSVGREVESPNYVISDVKDKNRFIPQVDFTSASNFAFYGSAEKYYEDSINYIINEYPYDGSGKEKINWNLSGTYLDRYIFENEYPRTNGFVVMGYNYGSNSDSPTHGYYAPVSQEYIYFKGGPNTGSLTSGTLATQFYDSNLYNTGALGKNNLELDGDKGLTLEFWLHKTAWNSSAESRRQVIFDLWNSASFAGHDYGRFRVEIEGNPEESNQLQPYFNVELYSGSHAAGNGAGWSYSSLSPNTTLALSSSAQFTGSWNHFALSFANSGSQMVGRLYRNGILENSVVTGSSMGNISGPMIGYIGALATSVSGGIATSGSAKLSASLDEVRYWKNERNSKNIGQYWWTQVNGGTNSDYAFLSQSSTKYNFSFPADLGVYYKFNEGITEVQSIDSTLLDYAGRTTNGKWIGYSTTYPSRNTGSAIINAGASNTEFKDPILYLRHPAVASYRDDKLNQGKLYDVGNNSSIYGSIPEWITSDDENKGSADLKKLTQIISSYFDTLQLQIQAVPEIKNKEYTNLSASNRPLPFADRLLDNSGFVTPEIFSKATELEYLASRNNHESFSEKLNETKNLIYENIYNNLDYIYKSKGTEKAFRNLIRCFGVGEELVKINLYADNNDFILRDNVDYTVARKKYVDFYSGAGKDALIFQQTASANSDSRAYIGLAGPGPFANPEAFDFGSQPGSNPGAAIQLSENTGFTGSDGSFTISLWSKQNWQGSQQSLAGRMATGSTWGNGDWMYHLDRPANGANRMGINTTAGYKEAQISAVERVDDGDWHLIVAGVDVTGETVWVDVDNGAASDSSATGGGTLLARWGDMNSSLGNVYDGSGGISNYKAATQWSGSIDEVAFWADSLSSADISEIYNNGCPSDLTSHSKASLLKSWYRMGDLATDDATANTGEITDVMGERDGTPKNTSGDEIYGRTVCTPSTQLDYIGNTYELEALFPKDFKKSDSYYIAANFQSASLFGCHTSGSDLAYGGNGWGDPDEGNFQVHSIRKDISTPHAYFQLTSSAPFNIPELTSSVFKDVYSDSKWNFAVRIKPGSYPWADGVTGSTIGNYDVEFLGYNYVLDSLENSFKVTASVDSLLARRFLQANKRFYVGAHRNSFTGTVLQSTNIRASSCRVWIDYLDDATIKAHARDIENFGVKNPYGNTYMNVLGSAFGGRYSELDGGITPIPQMETLALNWDFATLTSSNASGQFVVPDASSGSVALTPSNAQGRLTSRWNWLGPITNYQHTGLGYGFANNATGSISKEYINNAKAMLPETLNSSEMVSIVTENEDKLFTRESRPVEYYFAFEKSMYNVVSQEILKIFATIVDFNNLIGEPVNRYRQGYKQMEKLRSLYFERFQETPNLEKFVEFYKWIDASISSMLYQLTPASSKFSDNLRTLVESHILERNKYWTKFPTLDAKTSDIEGGVTGINELLYSGKRGLAPVPTNATGTNCEWWYERTERDNPNITSDDATVDSQRNTFRSANDFRSGSGATLAVSRASTSTTTTYEGRTFAVRNFTKPYRFAVQEMPTIHGGNNYPKGKKLEFAHTEIKPGRFGVADIKLKVTASSVNYEKDCTDIINPNKKNRLEATFAASNAQPADVSAKVSYIYEGGKTSIFAPFSLFSSSFSPSQMRHFRSGTQISNYHDDSYGENNETPIQGPFTDAHVGGWQYRHQNINTGANDTTLTRAEAWDLSVNSTGYIQLASRNASTSRPLARPNANIRRNTFAKRPVNIRNIKWGTSSAVAGNYRFDYEAVQTSGRDLNNRYLIKSDGDFPVTASTYVSGIVDFGLPRFDLTGTNKYIFVERFSAPGGPEINSLGSLDVYSQQYSVYNSLNFRNAIVRNSLDGWLTEHCGPYGIDPTGVVGDGTTVAEHEVNSLSYNGVIAAYHKVNRNPVKVNSLVGTSSFELTTSVNYDNWFIQHAIPQSAIQYKWVNDSYERIHNQPFGYISNFTQLTGTSTQTASMVAFVTESDYATPGYPAGASIPVNYSNMISLIPKESSGDLNASGYKYQLEDTTVEWYKYNGVTASSDLRTLHVGDDMPTGWNTSVASRTPLLTDQYLEFEIGRSNSEARYVVGLNDDPPLISAGASGPWAFGDMEYYMYIGPNGALSYQRGTHVSNEFTMGRELKNPGIINVGDKFRINHRGNKVAYSYQKYGVGPFREFYAYSGSNTTISGTLYPDLAFYWTGIGQSPLLKNIHIGSENTVAAGYGYYSGSSILTGGLNSYLLTLNGPYQGASWKNIRGDQKPIPRLHRKKNIYSVAKPSGTFLNEVFLPNPDGTGFGRAYYNTRPDKNKRFIEPAVSFNKPLDTEFDVDGHSVTLRNTYANNKCLFSQGGLGEESLGSFLGIGDNNNNPQFYDAIRDSENYNNLTNLTSREIIFPREANTTLAKSRGRLYYSEFAALSGTYGSASFSLGHDGIDRPVLNRRTFWRDEEKDRNRVSAKHRAAFQDSKAYVSGTLINSMGFANGYSTSLYNFGRTPVIFSTNSTAYQATDKVSGNNIFDYPDMGELNCANFVQIAGLVGYATGNVTDFSLSESANFPTASAFYYHREFGKTNLGFSSYGVLPWRTAELSGKNPWYDSYEEYSEDIRRIGKNYSIVPEFNISEHMEYYSKNSFQFRTKNDKFLSLEGSNITSSAPQQSGSSNIRGFNEEFFKEYSHSDFQKYFASFENDLYCKKIKLKCNGVKKLLPYNGFYPSQRSLQLAQLFSQSVAPYIGGADRNVWIRGKASGSVPYAQYSGALATQALIQPFYAPGIMYNTIKSGIAVDWGAYTGSIYQDYGDTTEQPEDDAQFFLTQPPNYRIPFETILDPIASDRGLPISSSDGEGRVSLLYPSYRELFNENEGDGTAESTNYDRKPYFDLESEMKSVIDGSPEYNLYKLAASNFFAEIPNFFLKGNELKSIVSKPASDVSLVSGTTYFMDIYLSKDHNLLMIEDWLNGSRVGNPRGSSAYWSDNPPHPVTGSSNRNRSWNGRFFGPPSRAGRGPNDDSTTSTYTWMAQGDPAYAPYTPPYFYGDCQLTIAYEADAEDRTNFNYKKLFERATITQQNPTLDSMFNLLGGATSSAAQGQMPLTASLNVYGIFNEKETRFDQNGNVVQVVDTVSSERSKWVISPRMETPVLDFSSQPDLTEPQGTGKGMWSGYGTIPSNSGIRFGIRSTGPDPQHKNLDLNSRDKESLIDMCFDTPQERKVGEIALEKEISEAIVAIPFSPNAQSDSLQNPFAPTTQIMDKHFYKIRRNVFNDVYESYLNNKTAEVPTPLMESLSIQKMLKLSEKYVLPPELDFLSAAYRRTRRNPGRTDIATVLPIKPFVMYMFEFKHNLTDAELSDIWQGVMPDISRVAQKSRGITEGGIDNNVFEHLTGPKEFFHGKRLHPKTRWMIFKVKRKANFNYFDVTANTTDDAKFKTQFSVGDFGNKFSYNWPYDYCSLVELAQVEVEGEFDKDPAPGTTSRNTSYAEEQLRIGGEIAEE